MADNKKVESPKAGATSTTGAARSAPDVAQPPAPAKTPPDGSNSPDPDSDKKETVTKGADPAEAQVTKESVQDQITPKTTPPASASPAQTPVDQPAERVATPTVAEVKAGAEIKPIAGESRGDETMKQHVDAVSKSVDSYNESTKAVEAAKPFVKPESEKKGFAPTAEERLAQNVDAVAKSAEAYNESVNAEAKSTSENSRPGDTADKASMSKKAEVSRVAPLTGELRPDPENDSYVTPGKTLAPKSTSPNEPAPEYDPAPKVIAPLTGEVKPADETSYPTPGHVRDPSIIAKALSGKAKTFQIEGEGKGKFGVAPGQQVPLLHANEELWAGDEARLNDQKTRAKDIAEALASSDGLRRTRRAQKNLR